MNRQISALKSLMEQYNVKQCDLKNEFGGQSVVSNIINGKRQININQIKRLANKFNIELNIMINKFI